MKTGNNNGYSPRQSYLINNSQQIINNDQNSRLQQQQNLGLNSGLQHQHLQQQQQLQPQNFQGFTQNQWKANKQEGSAINMNGQNMTGELGQIQNKIGLEFQPQNTHQMKDHTSYQVPHLSRHDQNQYNILQNHQFNNNHNQSHQPSQPDNFINSNNLQQNQFNPQSTLQQPNFYPQPQQQMKSMFFSRQSPPAQTASQSININSNYQQISQPSPPQQQQQIQQHNNLKNFGSNQGQGPDGNLSNKLNFSSLKFVNNPSQFQQIQPDYNQFNFQSQRQQQQYPYIPFYPGNPPPQVYYQPQIQNQQQNFQNPPSQNHQPSSLSQLQYQFHQTEIQQQSHQHQVPQGNNLKNKNESQFHLYQQQQQQYELSPEDTYYNFKNSNQVQIENQNFIANGVNGDILYENRRVDATLNQEAQTQQREMSQGLSEATGMNAHLPDKEMVAFRFQDKEYSIFGENLINDQDANEIYSKLLQESRLQSQDTYSSHGSGSGGLSSSKKNSSSWRDDETHLLQWSLFTYALQKNIAIEEFTENDWGNVAEFIPTRDKIKCLKRWLFIQKLGGNKSQWNKKEDEALRGIVEHEGAKEWSKIAELLNQIAGTVRNGKQCRERWNNTLNPSIKKSKWTLQEDLIVLEKQKELGNKWAEISHYLNGRTENQIKNRFNCLIRKGQQMKSLDTSSNIKLIVDKLIKKFKDQISNLKSRKEKNVMQLQSLPQIQSDSSLARENEDFQISSVDDVISDSALDDEDDEGFENNSRSEFLNGLDGSEGVNDENQMDYDQFINDYGEYVNSQQNIRGQSDLTVGYGEAKQQQVFNTDSQGDLKISPSAFSNPDEEIKIHETISDFKQLHEHSFKVSPEGKKKRAHRLAAHKTKNLLMNFVRDDSLPKSRRGSDKNSSSGSIEKQKHSRTLSKQNLLPGSTFKKQSMKKSSKKFDKLKGFTVSGMNDGPNEYDMASQCSKDFDELSNMQADDGSNMCSHSKFLITDTLNNKGNSDDLDFDIDIDVDTKQVIIVDTINQDHFKNQSQTSFQVRKQSDHSQTQLQHFEQHYQQVQIQSGNDENIFRSQVNNI